MELKLKFVRLERKNDEYVIIIISCVCVLKRVRGNGDLLPHWF